MWSGQWIKFYKKNRLYIYITFCTPFVLFFLLSLIFPLPEFKLKQDYSTIYLDRNGELLRISLSPSGKYRIKLPLDQISGYMKKGMVLYEDKYFFYHFGINPVSVLKACILNVKNKKIISGASTINMQIARMLERRPRTILFKLVEMFRAFQLEYQYTKKELLGIYLNMIPMGGNIEGVGAGSYFYFGKEAENLSLMEASMLIGIPNSPNHNRPDRYLKNTKKQQIKVLSRICEKFGVKKDILKNAEKRSVYVKRFKNPYRCPHLIESGKKSLNKFFKQFTIDLKIQTYCENVLKELYAVNKTQNIYNGAILVVDNKSQEVIAYVGSPDYYDNKHGCRINGAVILRSPGSALKPFLYAKAIEQGIITPEKIVYDIPREYNNYNPHNYSKKTYGLVTARYALVNSLNIPAVRLEYEMQGKGLGQLLKELFPLHKDILIDKSGLTLALGGFCLSLEQMTSLYMMLANEGVYHPLKYYIEKCEVEESERQILDKRVCYIISEILSEYARPDLPYCWEFTSYLAKAALKTGTSFGLRDAWCIGYNPDYTVGVWLGNVNCRHSSFLVGIRKAAPLFMRIFNYLTKNSDSWFEKPEGVRTRKVCTVSGEKPGPYCKHLNNDFYIPGISSEKTCSVHKKIIVRRKDNVEVCPYCMKGDPACYCEKIIEYWPPDVISFLRKTGRKYSPVPEHNPNCDYYFVKDKPQIISPSKASVFEIDENLPMNIQKIPLKVHVAQDADKIYWFLGSQLIAQGKVDETYFFSPQRGKWIISAIDSKGRSDSVTIMIY